MADPLVDIIADDARRIVAATRLDVLAGKTILVTGASGLLGTYFLCCLQQIARSSYAPRAVTAVVHSRIGHPLSSFVDFPEVGVVSGDLADPTFVNRLGSFDYIIHAAGYGQPGRFMEDPVKTLRLNTATTLALFEHIEPDGRFLFLSTSEVYSGLPHSPYREDQIGTTNTTHPRSCYIEAKRCGEAICNAYRQRGFAACSARLALAYGPGTKPADRRVLNAFIERGLTQGKISLQDMGMAKRTYCYVQDAVEILWHILLHGTAPIYNVGGMSRTTIAELARAIADYLHVPVEFPQQTVELGGAPEDVSLDMSLVANEFKRTSYVDLATGLAQTIEWQRALYSR